MTHWHSFPDSLTRPAEVWFSLPAGPQRSLALSDFLGRGSLCLLFVTGTTGREVALLEALSRARPLFRQEEAELAAVIALHTLGAARLAEDMGLAFPLLSDPEDATRRRFASLLPTPPADAPLVFVLDRFGAPRAATWLDRDDGDDWIGQALDWVDLADLACPE